MYREIPCTEEQLFPTRWITGAKPDRETMADHLRNLRIRWGNSTALECRRRMMWVGIFPVTTREQRRKRFPLTKVHSFEWALGQS